jgi:hypothetical protein
MPVASIAGTVAAIGRLKVRHSHGFEIGGTMNRVVRPPGGWGRSWSVVVVMVIAGCGAVGPGASEEPSSTPTADPIAHPAITDELRADLVMIRDAVDKYRDREVATADGYEIAQGCLNGAGSHWMNRDLVDDPELDLLTPEVLMYDGSGELVGIEYFVFASQVPRPELLGRSMDGPFTVRGVLAEPIWWRHVWLYRESPAGIFSMTNFNVTC